MSPCAGLGLALPAMGQKVAYALVGLRRNPAQHVADPVLGINSVQLAGAQQRIEHRRSLRGCMRARKQVVLSPDGDGPDRALHGVVVDFDSPVFEVADELRPPCQRVPHRLPPDTPRQTAIRLQPELQGLKDRPRLLLAHPAAHFRTRMRPYVVIPGTDSNPMSTCL